MSSKAGILMLTIASNPNNIEFPYGYTTFLLIATIIILNELPISFKKDTIGFFSNEKESDTDS